MKLILSLILLLTMMNSSFGADFGDCQLLKQTILFYKAQRAGRLPDADVPWRGDSVLTDASAGSSNDINGDGNLSKGFFDAGDAVKFAFPMTYTMTMLNWNYLEFKANIDSCGLQTLYSQVLKWGVDYILASHLSDNEFVAQVGDGVQDHAFWGPPELLNYKRPVYTITKNAPGTDLAMEAVASLASASIVFKTSDPTYSANCLQHATTLFNFAIGSTFKKYSESVPQAAQFYSSSNYNDELAWGTIWMYKATGNTTYLNTAKTFYQTYQDIGKANEFSWENKGMGVSLLLWKETQDTQYKSKLESVLDMWVTCNSDDRSKTTGGLCFLRQWASNRYSMAVSHLAAIYKVNAGGNVKYSTFAQSQLHYVIGNNTKQQSFITGYGPNYPKKPHHRGSHHSTTNDINVPVNNLYTLPGALVGGPLDTSDQYTDNRDSYVSNEVALDYNIGLVGTLSAYSVGTPTSTTSSSTTSSTTSTTSTSTTSSSTTSTPVTTTTTSTPATTSTTTSTPVTTASTTSTSATTTSTPVTTKSATTSTSATTTLGEEDSDDELINNSNSLIKLFNAILLIISMISISIM